MNKNDRAELLEVFQRSSERLLHRDKKNWKNIRSLKTHLHQPIKLLPMTFPLDKNFNELGSLLLKLDIPCKDLDDLLSLIYKPGISNEEKNELSCLLLKHNLFCDEDFWTLIDLLFKPKINVSDAVSFLKDLGIDITDTEETLEK